ncbi:MAG: hypothetical protein LBI44_00705 [Oscillospiraceae bacterium]|jgi:hypothetical protein|nr:hypothetical protein [Oscillospiraceae bacterium]
MADEKKTKEKKEKQPKPPKPPRSRGERAVTLALLGVLVGVLAGAGVFWAMGYIHTSWDGTKRLILPFFARVTPPPTHYSPAPPSLAPVPPSPSPSPSPSPLPPAPDVLKALYITADDISDPDALTALRDSAASFGAQVVLADRKSDGGAPVDETLLQDAAFTLGDGFTYMAYISLFQDSALARESPELAVKHSAGFNWLDSNGCLWLNPFSDEVADYLLGVIAQAASEGYDAILLDNLCFPYDGNLSTIDYGERDGDSRGDAILAFIDKVLDLQIELPIYAAVTADTAAFGANPEAGQTLSDMQERFAALYLPRNDTQTGPPDGSLVILREVTSQ